MSVSATSAGFSDGYGLVKKLRTDDGKESQLFKDLDQMKKGKHDHVISKKDLEIASEKDDETGKFAKELLNNKAALDFLTNGGDKFKIDNVNKFDSKA
jgi:hypothetical protein